MLLSRLKETVLDSDNLILVYCTLARGKDLQCAIFMKIIIESYSLTWRYFSNSENSIFISMFSSKTERLNFGVFVRTLRKIFLLFEPLDETTGSMNVVFGLSGELLGKFDITTDVYKNIYDGLNIEPSQRIHISVECIDLDNSRFLLKESGIACSCLQNVD